ncbi:tyrosine-protein phosphatase [Cohnella hashimotonis]|uniref:Tyrosine-protein phosphatase n=1 Tax=Cohnella hashimotonis TaxID=2826895 RepID=A0ABT6TTY9_9BACL|nr:CpsB/CapC family capsule biosynthesis tyrosine phosphatase [Cohnella hashimotonis]MDI4650313.1 protein tyrosine phosphatase [Cohnella hashimotonis]
MIDIHSHILPGLDDGAQDWEDALALARAAAAEGIETIIATPHHANGEYDNLGPNIVAAVEAMNERLMAEGIGLTVRAGQEIRVHDDLLDAWARGDLLTLAGTRYILIELPTSRIPRGLSELLHELKLLNLSPIIAHPERNAEIVSHPERLAELVAAGAYGQVTTHSLLGAFGKRIEQASWQLCREGLIHLVSSDAHHVTKRGFLLQESYCKINRLLGVNFELFFRKNAESVLYNGDMSPHPPIARNERLWMKFAKILRKS